MAEKDLTEKTLEAFNDVFADIVNALMFKGNPVVTEEALTDAQPFSVFKADGRLRGQERDVSKYWHKSDGQKLNIRIAFLGIENQSVYDKDMPFRVISYDGASYKAQLSRKECYPVITLVLHFGNERWGKNRTLYDVIEVPENMKEYVNDYRINVFEMAWLSAEQINRFKSDFKIVADYFSNRRKNTDYRPENPEKIKHVDELLKLMSVMTNDGRFVEALEWEGGKPETMCELLDRVEARGIAKGEATGFAKGEAMGIATGRETVAKLLGILLQENRIEDIQKIASDNEYLEKLCRDYNLV